MYASKAYLQIQTTTTKKHTFHSFLLVAGCCLLFDSKKTCRPKVGCYLNISLDSSQQNGVSHPPARANDRDTTTPNSRASQAVLATAGKELFTGCADDSVCDKTSSAGTHIFYIANGCCNVCPSDGAIPSTGRPTCILASTALPANACSQ